MLKRLLFLTLGGLLSAPQAHAHSYDEGLLAQIETGGMVVFTAPETLLPLLALGVLLSLWQPCGMTQGWPMFLAGQAAGIPTAVLLGDACVTVLLATGLTVAVLAALLSRHHTAVALLASFALGGLAVAVALDGHGIWELPPAFLLGVVVAINLTTAGAAVIAGVALSLSTAFWMRVVWRVAASWLAATMTLILAFTVAPG